MTTAVSAIDSLIFGDLFGTQEMRALFSDSARLQGYLDVEAALARVQAHLGVIPQEAAREITRKARWEALDLELYSKRVTIVGFPILPLVEQLVALCDDGLGEYSHWGATTQDVMDTALALQLKRAFSRIDADLEAVSDRLRFLAERHRGTVMAGRSQLQHALPVTFGYKAAVWLAAVDRHRVRLAQLRPRVEVGQFGGAVGTLASLTECGLEVQAGLCEELGLGVPKIAWHTTRDSLAEAVGFLSLVTGTLAKIGKDVTLMSQTEVSEVAEGVGDGRGASSTMPQKRNPIGSQMLIAAHQAVSRNAGLMLDALPQDHERSTGLWQMEWVAIPDAFVLAGGALSQVRRVLDGLQIDVDKMRDNLDVTEGLIATEAVMMALAPHLGRQRAHDLVATAVNTARETETPVEEALSANGEIAACLSVSEIRAALDPTKYLGHAELFVDRAVTQGPRGKE